MAKQTVIVNITSMQPSYNSMGLGPIPGGTTPDQAVTTLENALWKNVQTGWPAKFEPIDTTQQDRGIMGPWSANIAGTAPPCLVQQITLDFNDWELPNDPTTITAIAQTITQQVSSNGGIAGSFYGKHNISAAEEIDWGVGFATGAIADNPEELGIIYVFNAVLKVL